MGEPSISIYCVQTHLFVSVGDSIVIKCGVEVAYSLVKRGMPSHVAVVLEHVMEIE